jgi:hypothetical protein
MNTVRCIQRHVCIWLCTMNLDGNILLIIIIPSMLTSALFTRIEPGQVPIGIDEEEVLDDETKIIHGNNNFVSDKMKRP